MQQAYSNEAVQSYKSQMVEFIKNKTVPFSVVKEAELNLRKTSNKTIFTDFDLLELSKLL
jgi:hypothetical protein